MAISFTADESPNPETPASEKYAVGDVRSSKRGGPAGRANVLDVSNISFGCVIGCVIYVYVHIYIYITIYRCMYIYIYIFIYIYV